MESTSASLTVFFEDPFWVAVYQRMECGRLRAAKVVFGKEPKECGLGRQWKPRPPRTLAKTPSVCRGR